MAVKLRPEVRSRVRDAIAQALPHIQVGSYIAMSFAFMAVDMALPKKSPVRELLARYLDDFPLSDFINDVLSEDLERRDDFRFDSERKLTDLEGYDDPKATAEELISRFETLPWSYALTAVLPHQLRELIPDGAAEIQLGPSLRICRPTHAFQTAFPLLADNPAANDRLAGPARYFNRGQPRAAAQWAFDEIYFQIDAQGFIQRFPYSPTVSTAERLLRSFCGLGLATGLFQSHSYLASHSAPIPVFVHRRAVNGKWEPFTRYNLSESVARGLRTLYVGHPNDVLRIKPLDTERIAAQLAHINAALSLGQKADQTLLAAQWLFDGSTGHDPLLTFVQSMVVLEILLGDKSQSDQLSISTLISNRLAYLVGKTHEERTSLIATFKEIYAVRSQIVHSGKPHLRSDDHRLLDELRRMGRAAITKELDALLTPRTK